MKRILLPFFLMGFFAAVPASQAGTISPHYLISKPNLVCDNAQVYRNLKICSLSIGVGGTISPHCFDPVISYEVAKDSPATAIVFGLSGLVTVVAFSRSRRSLVLNDCFRKAVGTLYKRSRPISSNLHSEADTTIPVSVF